MGYGGAKRWLEDGTLVIDSRESIMITDYYVRDMAGRLDPEPQEVFLAQWRIKVVESTVWGDPGVGIYADDAWAVGLTMTTRSIRGIGEPGKEFSYTPGEFHDFELRSFDMRNYALRVDGVQAWEGRFAKVVSKSQVIWGDTGEGSTSLARWDYFRFGVLVPEPGNLAACTATAGVGFYVRRRLREPAK
jgi:hypothetical protein